MKYRIELDIINPAEKQKKIKQKASIIEAAICPCCNGELVAVSGQTYVCSDCAKTFKVAPLYSRKDNEN